MKVTISELESTILALKSDVKSLQSEKDELSGENQSLLDQVNSYQVRFFTAVRHVNPLHSCMLTHSMAVYKLYYPLHR